MTSEDDEDTGDASAAERANAESASAPEGERADSTGDASAAAQAQEHGVSEGAGVLEGEAAVHAGAPESPRRPSDAALRSLGDAAADDYGFDDGLPMELETVRYVLERVEVRGNERTSDPVIENYVPLEEGDVLDPEDPRLEAVEWRLLGTGWFDRVTIRLERGERRGWVVLVVDVEERNTIIISSLSLGVSEGINSTLDTSAETLFYAAATLTETNFLGSGARLDLTGFGSARARGVRLAYVHPNLLPRNLGLRGGFFYNNARQFYGNDPLVTGRCPPPVEPSCVAELEARNAVLFYNRGGIWAGIGRSVRTSLSFQLDWQGELLSVRSKPDAASERRGSEVRPIDFAVADDALSRVSMLRFAITYDRRNDPVLPSRGSYVRLQSELNHRVLGSDYEFLRLQLRYRGWIPLGERHSISGGVYIGAVFGDAPFFYLFHVSDLTDLIPSRVLEMQLDRRPPPDLFGTAIEVMRAEELAGRVDLEYQATVYHGAGFFRSLRAYANLGLYALADPRDIQLAVPGFDGIAKLPFDLTFDVGVRLDTTAGVFQLGFSNLLGFISL